jgi:hypothetical protein
VDPQFGHFDAVEPLEVSYVEVDDLLLQPVFKNAIDKNDNINNFFIV